MIIAVDFDGTLCINNQPNIQLINAMKSKQKSGDYIVLWTCREGKRLQEAVMFLRNYGFIPNAINENHPNVVKRLGYNSRKIQADVYIDDKNI